MCVSYSVFLFQFTIWVSTKNYITSHSNDEMFQDTLQIQIHIQILLSFWAWDIPLVYECTT